MSGFCANCIEENGDLVEVEWIDSNGRPGTRLVCGECMADVAERCSGRRGERVAIPRSDRTDQTIAWIKESEIRECRRPLTVTPGRDAVADMLDKLIFPTGPGADEDERGRKVR